MIRIVFSMIRTQVVDRKWQSQKVKSLFCGSWKNNPDHDPLFILVFLKKIGSWSVIVLPKNSINKSFPSLKRWLKPIWTSPGSRLALNKTIIRTLILEFFYKLRFGWFSYLLISHCCIVNFPSLSLIHTGISDLGKNIWHWKYFRVTGGLLSPDIADWRPSPDVVWCEARVLARGGSWLESRVSRAEGCWRHLTEPWSLYQPHWNM